MVRALECAFLLIASAVALLPVTSEAQQSKELAPLPSQIAAAKRVFISNAGVDIQSLSAFRKLGNPDYPYHQFYTAMKSWGRYELVLAPADADLVFELRFAMPLVRCSGTTHELQFQLTILDARMHVPLWALNVPVESAYRKTTFIKNFDEGMSALMDAVKKLSGTGGPGPR